MDKLTVKFYRDRSLKKIAWKNDEEVEDSEMAHIFCEPQRPSSHTPEKRDKLFARHFGLDQSLPQPKDTKVVQMIIRSTVDMSVLFPRDK